MIVFFKKEAFCGGVEHASLPYFLHKVPIDMIPGELSCWPFLHAMVNRHHFLSSTNTFEALIVLADSL